MSNYVLIKEDSDYTFIEKVNELLSKGYDPQGGIFIMPHKKYKDMTGYRCQAMYKKEDKNYFDCPECGVMVEEINDNHWGCGNEDCTYELTKG